MDPCKKAKTEEPISQIIIQFLTPEKEPMGPELDMPDLTTALQLTDILNSLQSAEENYIFYLSNIQVTSNIKQACEEAAHSTEIVVPLTVHPASLYRVNPATRATSCLSGHTESILTVKFSPDGSALASGSGDTTVRLWDMLTETPYKTLTGHKNWVLVLAWSPDGAKVASAGADGTLRIWASTGELLGRPLTGHKKWVTEVSWEPLHRNALCTRLATSSKDKSVRIWDVASFECLLTMNGHSSTVTKVLWGGEGLLYSGSQDRLVKV